MGGKKHSFYFASATKIDEEQVMRGHNIVADGWAGASNPQPHPNTTPLQHTHTYTNCGIINARFSRFRLERDNSNVTEKQTNGPTLVR